MRASILAVTIGFGVLSAVAARADDEVPHGSEDETAATDGADTENADEEAAPLIPLVPWVDTPVHEDETDADLPPLVPLPASEPSSGEDGVPTMEPVSGDSDAAVAPSTTVIIEEVPRSPWLRTPRLIAYGGGALGLIAVGVGAAKGLEARNVESVYERASVQIDAVQAKRRSEHAARQANTWFLVGGVLMAAAAGTIAFDVVYGPEPLSSANAWQSTVTLITGGAVSTWTVFLP